MNTADIVKALELLKGIAGLAGANAESVVDAVYQGLTHLIGGVDGSTDPTTVTNQIAILRDALAGQDQAADAALDAKFPKP